MYLLLSVAGEKEFVPGRVRGWFALATDREQVGEGAEEGQRAQGRAQCLLAAGSEGRDGGEGAMSPAPLNHCHHLCIPALPQQRLEGAVGLSVEPAEVFAPIHFCRTPGAQTTRDFISLRLENQRNSQQSAISWSGT